MKGGFIISCLLGHKFNILYEACSAEKYNILLYFCTFMDAQKLITTNCSLESKNDFAKLFSTK
jgi:hypothetical protein